MLQKITCLFIVFLAIVNSCLSQNPLNQEVKIGNINYFLLHTGTAKVRTGNYVGNITIPAVVKFQGKNYKVQEIGFDAFKDATELIAIQLPEGLKTIERRAFENCNKLKQIRIPTTVEKLDHSVFFKCKQLSTIEIPENVTAIGEYAFSFCEALQSITVSPNNTHFTSLDGVLYSKDLKQLIKVPETKTAYQFPDSVETIEKGAFENCQYLKTIDLPEKITALTQDAFDNCNSLTQLFIPKNVNFIGLHAFRKCPNLKAIQVDSENQHFSAVDGILYNLDKTRLIHCPAQKETVEIDTNTKTIASYAFYNCQKLRELNFPENLKRIESSVFRQCNSLENVYINSKEPIKIIDDAFTSIKDKVTLWVAKETIESYQKSNSLSVKELRYKILE